MNLLATLREKITRYLEVELKLVKIGFMQHTSRLLSYVIFSLILLFIIFCIVLFSGFGLKESFVSAGLSATVSFFLTTGIYLVLLMVVFALRRRITRFLAGQIVNVMTEVEEENDDKEEE